MELTPTGYMMVTPNQWGGKMNAGGARIPRSPTEDDTEAATVGHLNDLLIEGG